MNPYIDSFAVLKHSDQDQILCHTIYSAEDVPNTGTIVQQLLKMSKSLRWMNVSRLW